MSSSISRHIRDNVVGYVACCVAASAVLVGHASAKQIFQESFHDEGGLFHENFCGVERLTVKETFVADVRVRVVSHGPDGFAYLLEHVRETSVLTNPDGKAVTFVRTGSSGKDLKVTDNGDGTLTTLVRVVGNDVLYGSEGKAIARDPGQSRFEVLSDHSGTPTDPFDDEVIAVERVTESTGRTDDFCAATFGEWT
jgi:hypothetical protein